MGFEILHRTTSTTVCKQPSYFGKKSGKYFLNIFFRKKERVFSKYRVVDNDGSRRYRVEQCTATFPKNIHKFGYGRSFCCFYGVLHVTILAIKLPGWPQEYLSLTLQHHYAYQLAQHAIAGRVT